MLKKLKGAKFKESLQIWQTNRAKPFFVTVFLSCKPSARFGKLQKVFYPVKTVKLRKFHKILRNCKFEQNLAKVLDIDIFKNHLIVHPQKLSLFQALNIFTGS